MKLSVIIVSYNTAELTLQTLTSVLSSYKAAPTLENQVEVIIVDNNSSDNTISEIKKSGITREVSCQVIENKSNSGFAVANNQAISMARGEYILLLNSDTIVETSALSKLVSIFDANPIDEVSAHTSPDFDSRDRLGVISPLLLNSDQTTQPQGGAFPSLLTLFFHMTLLDDLPLIGKWLPSTQYTGKRSVSSATTAGKEDLIAQDWVAGTAMMIRKTVFDESGLLDGNIFMYGEDMEFCMRAKAHHWDVALYPAAHITHLGSASSSSQNAIIGELKGYLYIWSKHKPFWQLPIVRFLIKLGIAIRIFLFGTMKLSAAKADIYQEAWKQV
ncbi:MAG: glycosyltransferase family 2 protein [bacterium]|nr:glycosyltransferase family 2 protein [bacterium]